MTQKVFKGDLVQVGEMPAYMAHFDGNCKAIVLYTYAEVYGGSVRHAESEGANMTQKFFKGDLVHVGEMPVYMDHFEGNCKAIVLYTYAEEYGGGAKEEKQYCLHILPRGGEVSWYEEKQLTLVEADRLDLLPKSSIHRKVWEAKKARDSK